MLSNALCIEATYCMDKEDKHFFLKPFSSFKRKIERKIDIWKAEKNGEVVRLEFVGEPLPREEPEEEKEAMLTDCSAKNTSSLVINVEIIASEVKEEELEEEETQFLMLSERLSKRLHITLSKPILKDEKTIRTYFKEGPYDSLHLTF